MALPGLLVIFARELFAFYDLAVPANDKRSILAPSPPRRCHFFPTGIKAGGPPISMTLRQITFGAPGGGALVELVIKELEAA